MQILNLLICDNKKIEINFQNQLTTTPSLMLLMDPEYSVC